ncbi:MAG: 30S ribosomal protein S9 [Deltaproteobacteria bacterium RIFOXYA12_FULL_61_11]|nr:MAG: 30S ribosomal protein S9 [Deltaproteobacteria bacterium RIFOXYA12_FULL_61_11]
MADANTIHAVGKRKSAVARVFLKPGQGKVIINSRPIEEFFGRETDIMIAMQPLEYLDLKGRFDLTVTVRGGGSSGQAGAIKHGIARSLLVVNPDYRPRLKEGGFLTRDARIKERDKYGLAGARRGYQFSKR